MTFHPVEQEAPKEKDKPEHHHPDLYRSYRLSKIPEPIQQRNKRIFGALDLHLKKAKIKLESEEEQVI